MQQTVYAKPPAGQTSSPVRATSVNEIGDCLVTAHQDATLTFWRSTTTDDWDELASYSTVYPPDAIQAVAFAPTSLHPAMVACAGDNGSLVLVSHSSRLSTRTVQTVLNIGPPLSAVAFSDTGVLAALSDDNVVHIFESSDAEVAMAHHASFAWRSVSMIYVDNPCGLSFAPGGSLFVTGETVIGNLHGESQWDEVAMFQGPSKVCSIHWARSGFVALARENADLEIWRLKQGKSMLVQRITMKQVMKEVQWDRVGSTLAAVDGGGSIWTFARELQDGQWKWAKRDNLLVTE